MTRVTPGSRVRDAIVRASSPASAGTVFIFQFAAITTGRMARSCQRRPHRPRAVWHVVAGMPGPPARPAPADAAVVVEREALDAVEGALDGGTVEVEAGGDLGQRRLRGLAS